MPFDFEFEVDWFADAGGSSPVEAEIGEIARSNPAVANRMRAALAALPDGRRHREPFTKDLGNGLHEVRLEGRVDVRILFAYCPGRRIVILHAFAKKSQKTPPKNVSIAQRRRRDRFSRHVGGGS